MLDPFTSVLAGYLAINVPNWLEDLRNMLLDKGKETVLAKGKAWLDEKEQQRILQQVLTRAVKRGLTGFRKLRERDEYKAVLSNLFEPGEHSDALRRAAMTIFNLSDTPDIVELNAIYNRSLRTRNLSQTTPPAEVDAAPYLVSFFDALLVEMYDNAFFRSQISDAIQTRTARLLPRQVAETNTTLREIHKTLKSDYTDEQFQRDIATYTAYIESTLHNLKIIGFLPKDYNKDPAINGIFVPLNVALSDPDGTDVKQSDALVILLQKYPQLVLLGDPGSGKSTTVRHLAWSHAWANLNHSDPGGVSLLPGRPFPLRIELRLFIHAYNQHPDYSFLSYVTDVLMKHSINILMFERLLTQKRMLILFDGLDEVTTLDERQRLVQEIEHFVQLYPNNYAVVTSRPVGYNLASCSQRLFTHGNVQGFNDQQIHQFLERWYKYVLGLAPLPDQEQQELETLFVTLKENTRLHKLAENPLLLTVITGLYRSQRLPEKRVQVYEKCAEILLETWAKLKGTDIRWAEMKMGRDDQFACVAHLGFQLHSHVQKENNNQRNSRSAVDTSADVPARVIRREIERFLNVGKLIVEVAGQRKEAELFLRLMQEEAGLIVERGIDEAGENIYGFVHRTFQEYFAAVDVYGRYEQSEDPIIIQEFLVANLHDPHWREVILLLLGKLGRKRVTLRLRQILDGTIRSHRSHYTEVLQQDLFFICDCLIDEMDVESDFAETVVSRISSLVTTAPFHPQRTTALNKLVGLMQTRQFASLAKRAWVRLVTLDTIPDINLGIQIVNVLRLPDLKDSHEQRLAIQMLMRLLERPNLTVEQTIQALQALYQGSPRVSDERNLSIQRLLEIAQQSDVTVEQTIQALQALYQASRPRASEERMLAGHRLLDLSQQRDITVEQAIQVMTILYQSSSLRSEERKLAGQRFLELAQRPDITVEQAIQVMTILYQLSPLRSEERKLAGQRCLELAQRPDLTVGQTIQVMTILYRSRSSELAGRELAEQRFLELAQRPDITVELAIQVLVTFSWLSLQEAEERKLALQLLLRIAQRPDITVYQSIQVFDALCQSSPQGSEEEKLAIEHLLEIAQRPDLTVDQTIEALWAFYRSSQSESEEEKLAIEGLLKIVQRPDLTVEQVIQVLRILYGSSSQKSENHLRAIQLLWQRGQDTDISLAKRLAIVTIPIEEAFAGYADKLRSIQAIKSIVPSDHVKEYIGTKWNKGYAFIKEEAPYMIDCLKQELLPDRARDDLYDALTRLVPQFNACFSDKDD